MSSHETTQGLHYADDGDRAQASAAVALHSIGADHRLWDPVVDALVEVAGRVVRPDSRGHGRSRWPGEVTLDGWLRDLDVVLDHAGVDAADLLGISMGGVQALAYAASRPERVRSLVVLDSFSRLDPDAAAAKVDTLVGSARDLGMPAFADQYVSDTVLNGVPRAIENLRAAISGMSVEAFAASARACFTVDLHDRLATIDAPSLVLWGERDQKTPRELNEAIATALPDGRLVAIPEAGHLPTIDNPTAVSDEIRRFVAAVRESQALCEDDRPASR